MIINSNEDKNELVEKCVNTFNTYTPLNCVKFIMANILNKEKIGYIDCRTDNYDDFIAKPLINIKNDHKSLFGITIPDDAFFSDRFDYGEKLTTNVDGYTKLSEYGKCIYLYGQETLSQFCAYIVGNDIVSSRRKLYLEQLSLNIDKVINALTNFNDDIAEDYFNYEDSDDENYCYFNIESLDYVISRIRDGYLDNITIKQLSKEHILGFLYTAIYTILLGVSLMLIGMSQVTEELFFDEEGLKNNLEAIRDSMNRSETLDKDRFYVLLHLYKKMHEFFAFNFGVYPNKTLEKSVLVMTELYDTLDKEEQERLITEYGYLFDHSNDSITNCSLFDAFEIYDPFNNFFSYIAPLMNLNLPNYDKIRHVLYYSHFLYISDNKSAFSNFFKIVSENTNIKENVYTRENINSLFVFLKSSLMAKFPTKIDSNIILILCILSMILRRLVCNASDSAKLKKENSYNLAVQTLIYAEAYIILIMTEWFKSNKKYEFKEEFNIGDNYKDIYLNTYASCTKTITSYLFSTIDDKEEQILRTIMQIISSKTDEIDRVLDYGADLLFNHKISPVVFIIDSNDDNSEIFKLAKQMIDNVNEETKDEIKNIFSKIAEESTEAPIIQSKLGHFINRSAVNIFNNNFSDIEDINDEVAKHLKVILQVLIPFGIIKEHLYTDITNGDLFTMNSEKESIDSLIKDFTPEDIIPNVISNKKYTF